jgi:hypothetical protein
MSAIRAIMSDIGVEEMGIKRGGCACVGKKQAMSKEPSVRYTEHDHKILLRILSILPSQLPPFVNLVLYMPSSRTFTSRTAHDHRVELFAELYTYFEDRRDYYNAALVLHWSDILGLRYDVWRFVSTGLYPSEEHIETWAFVDSDNQDAW